MTRRTLFATALAVVVLIAAAVYLVLPRLVRTGAGEPPLNFNAVSERLATSGQPSPAQFDDLRAQGFELVINLAPPDSYGSLAEEGALAAGRGMAYVNIPVDWNHPAARDFELFSHVLAGAGGRRAWVHCQINLRASAFVFLHRVIRERVPAAEAVGALHAVWVPNAVWKTFMEEMLRRHGVHFDPDLLS